MLDPRGVVFGPDPPAIPYEELQRQLESRTGAYCVLFDTVCLRSEQSDNPNKDRIHSLRDLIRGAYKRQVMVYIVRDIVRDDEGPYGQVTVTLSGGPAEEEPGGPSLEFFFTHDGKLWRLRHVEYS